MAIITYRDRQIDLKPYFEGFPYMGFSCVDGLNQLYYFHRGIKVTLMRTELSAHPDLTRGEKVSDLDFNTFSASGFQFDAKGGYAYFTGDEKNDEQFNVYRLDLATGDRKKLTDEEYIYANKFFKEDRKIYFIGRQKTDERMVSYFKVLDLETGEIKVLVKDDPDWQKQKESDRPLPVGRKSCGVDAEKHKEYQGFKKEKNPEKTTQIFAA